jgi:peptidoglycan/LPS O-acetylase OafA/YrhL
VLFFGSALFYTGIHAYYDLLLYHTGRGTVQLIPIIVLLGGALIFLGVPIAQDIGKKLKAKSLAAITLADLIGILSLTYFVLFPSQAYSSEWLIATSLNTLILIAAFLTGHSKKNKQQDTTRNIQSSRMPT